MGTCVSKSHASPSSKSVVPVTSYPALPTEQAIRRNGARRLSVSSEPAKFPDSAMNSHDKSKKPAKDPATKAKLLNIMSSVVILKELSAVQQAGIVDAMFERHVEAGEIIIRQGEDGDNFYVIENGNFSAVKDGLLKWKYEGKGSFGELALMYDCARAATIKADTDGTLWGLDRQTFRALVVSSTVERRKRHEIFLRSVKLFKDLSPEQLAAIADCLEMETYESTDSIIRQGEELNAGSKFYILETGRVNCYRSERGKKKLTRTLEAGDVFGEVALITSEPRAADCVAATHVKCLTMSKTAFERLMGPVESILAHYVEEYKTMNSGSSSSAQGHRRPPIPKVTVPKRFGKPRNKY